MFVPLFISLLACGEDKSQSGTTDITDLQQELLAQKALINLMQLEIDELHAKDVDQDEIIENVTSGVDVSALYATVNEHSAQIAQNTETSFNNTVDVTNAQSEVTQNTYDLNQLTQTVATLEIAHDARLATIEINYLTQADLQPYASQAWVAMQNYAYNNVVQFNSANIADNAANIDTLQTTDTLLNSRITTIENDYATSTTLADYATEAWVEGQAYALQTDLDLNSADIDNAESRLDDIESSYLSNADLIGYASETWVASQGYATTNLGDLSNYLSVDTNNNAIRITGANLYIESGSGSTDDNGSLTGLGNLVIGYDENSGIQSKTGSHNLVVGAYNSYTSYGSTISGTFNSVSGAYSSVNGGSDNIASGDYAVVSGGYANTASGDYATVSAGASNTASGEYSTVNGADNLTASNVYEIEPPYANVGALTNYMSIDTASDTITFSGANLHINSGSGDTADGGILTGLGNLIIGYDENTGSQAKTGSHNLIIGANHVYTSHSGLVTGIANTISAEYAVVSGGSNNIASGIGAAVSGGARNVATSTHASISGGSDHVVNGDYASASGGYNAAVSGLYASVSGGKQGTASGDYSAIAGGDVNIVSGSASTILGGRSNATETDYSTIVGGSGNRTTDVYGSILGGRDNTASGYYSSISGGRDNVSANQYSVVSGGRDNLADGLYSVVSGGHENTASGEQSVVSGGRLNDATANWSAVSAGYNNEAAYAYSCVSGEENLITTLINEHLP